MTSIPRLANSIATRPIPHPASSTLRGCSDSMKSAQSSEKRGASATRQFVGTPNRVAAPAGIVIDRLDPRLRAKQGQVEVWVSLDQNSVASERAALAEASGLTAINGATSIKSTTLLRQGALEHRQRIRNSQAALSGLITSLGGRELARVHVAHNAIAVRIDASQLKQLAALPGVAKVRPVLRYEMSLSETVPYVGGTAVQASGISWRWQTIATSKIPPAWGLSF